tara:strand:- start:902 stop:1027 length:126 start_codon:yes stop_codon:yes gene_type:complete
MAVDKVITFPQRSEVDRQFLELERQREAIRKQAELIAELNK